MLFECPLLEGRLERRYKRFLADIRLGSGELVVAHCPNPGAMTGCAVVGGRVWVRPVSDPKRRLRYTWELADLQGSLVCVNTLRANSVVAEAVAAGGVPEVDGFDELRTEVRFGEHSRVDLWLRHGLRQCFLEVKSVTLPVGNGGSAFPDSVTARGTRHVRELLEVVRAGHRGVMLFCARGDSVKVRPADEIDPVYGAAVREAVAGGVELLAYRAEASVHGMWLRERLPIEL